MYTCNLYRGGAKFQKLHFKPIRHLFYLCSTLEKNYLKALDNAKKKTLLGKRPVGCLLLLLTLTSSPPSNPPQFVQFPPSLPSPPSSLPVPSPSPLPRLPNGSPHLPLAGGRGWRGRCHDDPPGLSPPLPPGPGSDATRSNRALPDDQSERALHRRDENVPMGARVTGGSVYG